MNTSPAGGLVTAGETMGLLTAPGVGPLRHANRLEFSVAGAESNVAIGVRRLGCPATWLGRVGADEVGRKILAVLGGEGVRAYPNLVDTDAPTGLMLKERRTSDVSRVTYYRRGSAGSRLDPGDIDEDAVRAAGVVHLTGITAAISDTARATVYALIETARAAGVPVSFDINFRSALWRPGEAAQVLRDLAGRVDILLASASEAALLTDAQEDKQLAALAELGPADIIVKHGPRGAQALVGGEVLDVPPVPVRQLDPVGAGDAFAAGYLAALMLDFDAQRRTRLAAAVGALAVSVPGDWEGLPSLDEVDSLLGTDDVTR